MAYSREEYLKDFIAVNEELIRDGSLNPEEVAIIRRYLGLKPDQRSDLAA